jgi:cephalosporin-C deacetylase
MIETPENFQFHSASHTFTQTTFAPRNQEKQMLKKSKRLSIFILALLITLIPASRSNAKALLLEPFNPTGIYCLNEKVGWTVSTPDGKPSSRQYSYTIKENNFTVIQSGKLDLSAGPTKIEVSVNEPAMLYLQIPLPLSAPDALPVPSTQPVSTLMPAFKMPPKEVTAGAAVAPTQLQPVAPRPADFDDFWAGKIKLLESIPMNPVLTPGKSNKPDTEFDVIRMDHIDGHIWGQLAKPDRPGKFPAIAIFQWASPPYALEKNWVTDRAAEGWLALNIEPHDVMPNQPKSYYKALPAALKSYRAIGQDDREKSYFVRMYLADYRAVDYLASRPDWDGKTLVVMGTSMGGQQSLCVAGLNPKVTHLIVEEPSGCDMSGPLHGRQSGYPNFFAGNPKIMQTAQYVDAVNFAPHITATSLVAMGFVDTTAPPAGIWTAFNEIQGPKEAAPMIEAPHNNLATWEQQLPYNRRAAEWLKILVSGGSVVPTPMPTQSQ